MNAPTLGHKKRQTITNTTVALMMLLFGLAWLMVRSSCYEEKFLGGCVTGPERLGRTVTRAEWGMNYTILRLLEYSNRCLEYYDMYTVHICFPSTRLLTQYMSATFY
jgi:hypothetical protein